jgi:hypothetical protein
MQGVDVKVSGTCNNQCALKGWRQVVVYEITTCVKKTENNVCRIDEDRSQNLSFHFFLFSLSLYYPAPLIS